MGKKTNKELREVSHVTYGDSDLIIKLRRELIKSDDNSMDNGKYSGQRGNKGRR